MNITKVASAIALTSSFGLSALGFGLSASETPQVASAGPSGVVATSAKPKTAVLPKNVWTVKQVKTMKDANRTCWGITDDVTFEDCVIGEFVLQSHKYVDENGFSYDGKGHVILTGWQMIGKTLAKQLKGSDADKPARDFSACMMKFDGDTITVKCADGYKSVS